jgi:hypothetical protein
MRIKAALKLVFVAELRELVYHFAERDSSRTRSGLIFDRLLRLSYLPNIECAAVPVSRGIGQGRLVRVGPKHGRCPLGVCWLGRSASSSRPGTRIVVGRSAAPFA